MPPPLTPPEPPLATPRVRLRSFAPKDLPGVIAASEDPAITRFTFHPAGLDEASGAAWIAEAVERWADGIGRFAAVDPGTDELLGQAGVVLTPERQAAEGFYWLLPAARGRGLLTEALGLLVDWAFEDLGAQRFALSIEPANDASQAAARRAGFAYEGTMRSYEELKGRRIDVQSWAILPDDPRPWR